MRNLRLGMFRGKYCAIWTDGNPRRASLGTTDEAEAQRKFAEFKDRVHRASRPPEPTLGEIIDAYIVDRKAAGKDTSRVAYSKAAMAGLMALRPEHLTDEQVRGYITMRAGQGRTGDDGSSTASPRS